MTLWAFAVALRKESVDRNLPLLRTIQRDRSVALRKESVDRNRLPKRYKTNFRRRSPQGERG